MPVDSGLWKDQYAPEIGKKSSENFFVHSTVLSRPTGHVGESTRFVGEGEVGEGEVGETTLYPRIHIASLLHSSG